MYYAKKKAYIIFILFIYISSCQKNNLQDKNVENEILDETSISTNIMEISQKNDFILLEEIKLTPLEEEEGLKLEVEYSEKENIPDTFILYTTKGREFFRFQEKSYYQLDKSLKHFGYEGDLPKGMIFPYIDPSSIDTYGVYHREGLCFVDGKNGKVKLFSVVSFDLFEIDNSASYLCIGRSHEVPIVTIYNIETRDEIKKVVYEPYRDSLMYPIKIYYEDGAFIVNISADTDEFALLKIPIDGEDNYQVIDSFSYKEKKDAGMTDTKFEEKRQAQ